jgi:uncharacterized protein (DUF1697 family)
VADTCIALLRGINVVGKHRLPMKELAELLEGLGCTEVRTYIQSGNAVFRSRQEDREKLAEKIGQRISEKHGFRPGVLLLTAEDLQAAVAGSPFAPEEGKALPCYFLETEPASPDLERLAALKSASEEFKLDGNIFYFHAPDGIGRSKLAAQVERCLGVAATARNWNTVRRLLAMAGEE